MTHFTLATVLIVDDFPGWRARVREILASHPVWDVSEVSDGQEAVQQASELQPDLVVLDISPSLLNGLDAAEMIRQKSPKSRIVFLAQDNDGDLRRLLSASVRPLTFKSQSRHLAIRRCRGIAAANLRQSLRPSQDVLDCA